MEKMLKEIKTIYRFPVYQTREQYKNAIGIEPPPYNPNLPIKGWFDPDALDTTKNGEDSFIIYKVVAVWKDLANKNNLNQYKANKEGRPFIESYPIEKDLAAIVNIPPTGYDIPSSIIGNQFNVPVPVRDLLPNEKLTFRGLMGNTGAVVEVSGPNTPMTTEDSLKVLNEKVDRMLGLLEQLSRIVETLSKK